MQFDNVFVGQNIIALDRCGVVNLASPDPRELQVLGKFFVNQLGDVKQRPAAAHRVGSVVIRVLVVGQLGIDTYHIERLM